MTRAHHMTTYTDLQIVEIARSQRRILWLLLVSIGVVLGGFVLPHTGGVSALLYTTFIVIGIVGAVLIYRLATAMEEPWRWIYVVCAFIPYVSTVTLLILNVRATSALRARGIRVGLMGADKQDVARLSPTT